MSLLFDHIYANYGLSITDAELAEIRRVALEDIEQDKANAPIDDGGPISAKMVTTVTVQDGMMSEHLMEPRGGLSMRDYFASVALTGLLSMPSLKPKCTDVDLAKAAFLVADAMIQARKEGGK